MRLVPPTQLWESPNDNSARYVAIGEPLNASSAEPEFAGWNVKLHMMTAGALSSTLEHFLNFPGSRFKKLLYLSTASTEPYPETIDT